ncbi:arginine--tRNA ligase [Oceanospirillum sediminis]|uniref:Arginine--tRNA ligase n=1 Tax=Oceanospirillum sediminis TaxID=2760088 RepID=A0A839IU21_9GAMM|nr:arginine--tRNA ligase [Oceanospirillum sediminis]MBB1487979.1 arginine--tRNA ligase [Oceanospirillum sediminis]
MKEHIAELIGAAIETLKQQEVLPADLTPRIMVENTRDKSHGDFATNVALMLAKQAGCAPRDLAQKLVDALPESANVTQVDIAGPGFINFFASAATITAVVGKVLSEKDQYGLSQAGQKQKIQVEFVSANPTGPLHVGHGRGAAYGATVSDLLAAAGFDVHREYYVNDAGRQMDILATSVWLRYLENNGESFDFPSNGYKGDYIRDIAAKVQARFETSLVKAAADVFAGVPTDEPQGGDKEAHIDGLIAQAKALLGEDGYEQVFDIALEDIRGDIENDLGEFGVKYEEWFSERSLTRGGDVEVALKKLTDAGHIYEENGAQWFRSTAFGDDKDRCVVRDNGMTTYFASDIAYMHNKFERGFDKVLYLFGADHHGYLPRLKAVCQALGYSLDKLDFRLVQFAILYRGSERVQMSTRSGSFVTLRELRDEVGNDAARFFYVSRKSDQHMDFDLDLAKSQSKDNPVYYIQYAHARACSVMRKLAEHDWSFDQAAGLAALEKLDSDYEKDLMVALARYPEVLESCALNYEPHVMAQYLKDLASDFHSCYNALKVLEDDAQIRNARLALGEAVRQVLANGLKLLGVSAPEEM